ncbi:hypothetical protein N9J07_04895 [Bacteroidia bacterium]|nr:hypothetical protein [Bacteroidia bacterium]
MKKYLPLLIMVITLASCKDDEDKTLPEKRITTLKQPFISLQKPENGRQLQQKV